MTDKFSPPRHNKAAHSALSSLFFFPSPSPILPSYPCVSVSSSHASQPSTPSRLPPRHETPFSPFISTLLPAQTRFKLPLEISFPPFQSPENRFLPKKRITRGYQLARAMHTTPNVACYDGRGMPKGSKREEESRMEASMQMRYARRLLFLCPLPIEIISSIWLTCWKIVVCRGWLVSKFFHWFLHSEWTSDKTIPRLVSERQFRRSISFFFFYYFCRISRVRLSDNNEDRLRAISLQDLSEIKDI